MSRKWKIWRKVVSILMTVLMVAGGLNYPVFAEGTSTTSVETESNNQAGKQVEGSVEGTSTIPAKTESTVQATNSGEGRVDGTLTQAGTPLPNITFSIKSKTSAVWYDTKTDKDGKYRFDLPLGEYLLAGIWLPTEGKWYALEKGITVDTVLGKRQKNSA